MFNKKGQAALEFLTTYGWAFLVVLVMVGALAYFGVLSPSNFVSDKCLGTTMLQCDGGYAINANSTETNLQVDLTNIQQDFINITSVEMKEKSQANYTTISITNGTVIQSGEKGLIDVDFGKAMFNNMIGDKKIFLVKLNYKLGDSTINNLAEIEITSTVQEI